jgi:hypothetical protein
MTTQPGDRVLYYLDANDVNEITTNRANFVLSKSLADTHKHPHEKAPGSGAPGLMAHIGLPVHEGQELPADVIIINPFGRLSLRVLLPGSDVQWVENVPEGTGPGMWGQREGKQ